MPRLQDLEVSSDWDLVLTASGDLKLSSASATDYQEIGFRIRCERGELLFHPLFGAGLHRYVGQPLSQKLMDMIKADVSNALQYEARFIDTTILVHVIPTSRHKVGILVYRVEEPGRNTPITGFSVSLNDASIEDVNV